MDKNMVQKNFRLAPSPMETKMSELIIPIQTTTLEVCGQECPYLDLDKGECQLFKEDLAHLVVYPPKNPQTLRCEQCLGKDRDQTIKMRKEKHTVK